MLGIYKNRVGIIMNREKCNSCFGYGFWSWTHIAPMGAMDAEDGVPTTKCPECGANPNPRDGTEARYEQIKKLYDEGKLKFGCMEDIQAAWRLANE